MKQTNYEKQWEDYINQTCRIVLGWEGSWEDYQKLNKKLNKLQKEMKSIVKEVAKSKKGDTNE